MELTSLLTAGPMALVVWILLGVIGVVALFRLFLKKPMQLRRHDAEERVLKTESRGESGAPQRGIHV